MWPFSRKKYERVTISLSPQNITCCWLERSQKNEGAIYLKAYARTPLKQLEFSQAIIFNPTLLKKQIRSFLQTHRLQSTPAVLAVSGPKIVEHVIQTKTTTPTVQELGLPELRTLTWDSIYLCPSQKGGFDFFVCGMKPEYLFSYQLLAMSAGANITTIATEQLAHLQLYRHRQETLFRKSKLSLDLLQQRYNPSSLSSVEELESLLSLDEATGIDLSKEHTFLGTSLGLFLSEETT